MTFYETIIYRNPDEADYAGTLYERATTNLETALYLNPNLSKAYYNLGIALSRRGYKDEAMRYFAETIRLAPDYTDAHLELGLAYLEAGDRVAARREFEAVLRINPNYEKARRFMKP